MKYYVNLVQRGIHTQAHPVSGKSGKLYGSAVNSPASGGVVFRMALDEFTKDAHDLIGNMAAAQQWVPEFVAETTAGAAERYCGIPAGCKLGINHGPAIATHMWESHLFCEEHAPSNASRLDGQPSIAPVAPPQPPAVVEEVRPVLKEKDAQFTQPVEHLPPPAVASEDVESIQPTPPPAPTPVPPAADISPQPDPVRPPAAATAPPAPAPAPKAVDVIAQAVATALAETLPGALASMEDRIVAKLKPGKLAKKAIKTPDLKPTAFRMLQQEAKAYGINTYGKSADAIKAEIAEKKAA